MIFLHRELLALPINKLLLEFLFRDRVFVKILHRVLIADSDVNVRTDDCNVSEGVDLFRLDFFVKELLRIDVMPLRAEVSQKFLSVEAESVPALSQSCAPFLYTS